MATDLTCYNEKEMADVAKQPAQIRRYGPFQLRGSSSEIDWPRWRFGACVGLFGGVLGGAVVLVSLLTQVENPYINIPEHPPFGRALTIAIPGFLSGMAVTGPLAYMLFGPPFTFVRDRLRQSRGLPLWMFIGMAYSLVLALVLGGLFIPYTFLFQDFTGGLLSVPEFLSRGLDLTIMWPYLSVIVGIQLMFTSIFAGVFFGVGAWIIDRFNTSAHPATAKFGTWIVAVVLSGVIIALVTLIPETTLSQLG